MYALDIFKKNNIDYSWETILIGRKLEFLLPEEVSKYAVEYLIINPDCVDSNITELAYGVPERDIDVMLEKALKNLRINIQKDGPIWNLEKRKWRYCILKTLEKSFSFESFFNAFEIIYADFGYPEDMGDFLYNVPINEISQTQEYYIETTKKEFKIFLEKEKLRIDRKATDWPKSTIYYPIDENEFKTKLKFQKNSHL